MYIYIFVDLIFVLVGGGVVCFIVAPPLSLESTKTNPKLEPYLNTLPRSHAS